MNVVTVAVAAGLAAGIGIGIDKANRRRLGRSHNDQLRQQTAALDEETERQEQMRHESELRSGETDMLG